MRRRKKYTWIEGKTEFWVGFFYGVGLLAGVWVWAELWAGVLIGVLALAGLAVVIMVVAEDGPDDGAEFLAGVWAGVAAWALTVIVARAFAGAWALVWTGVCAGVWVIRKRKNANRTHRTPSRLLRFMPPDSRAYLHELRKRWRKRGYSKWLIELKTYWWVLGMLWGHLQCQLDNFLFPFKKS